MLKQNQNDLFLLLALGIGLEVLIQVFSGLLEFGLGLGSKVHLGQRIDE